MSHRGGVAIAVVAIVLSCSSEEDEPPPPKVYRPNLLDVAIGKHWKNGGPFAVAVSEDGRMQWSENFVDWTAGGNAFSGPPLRAISYAAKVFLAGGVGYHLELCPSSLSGCVDTGANTDTVGYRATTICPGFGYYLVGEGGYVVNFSAPGQALTFAKGPTGSDVLVGVACDATKVVVVSANDAAYTGSLGAPTLEKVSGTGHACGLALGNGLFVEARVDGTIETTSDGKTWTVTATAQWATVDTCDVAFGGGTFVVATTAGDIFTSGDAKTWTKFDYGAATKLNGIGVSEEGKMLAAGDAGVIIEGTCAGGTCSDPKRHDVLVEALGRPRELSTGSSSGGSSGGSCDGCRTDSDCTAVAQKYGATGAACEGGICYPCRASCSAGGVNCKCLDCSLGCGDAECFGTTPMCAYKRDGKKPCD